MKNFRKRFHHQVKNQYLHANSKKDTLFIRGAVNLKFSFQNIATNDREFFFYQKLIISLGYSSKDNWPIKKKISLWKISKLIFLKQKTLIRF